MMETVNQLRDQGKCVIFSTHIMREAERLCDRIAIMHRGCILTEGTIDTLREHHHQPDLEELFFELISTEENRRHQQAAVTA
jgi:sodium transport system ATP-binding protein